MVPTSLPALARGNVLVASPWGTLASVKVRHLLAAAVALLVCFSVITVVAGDEAPAAHPRAEFTVVALGDSVTSGVACQCTAFPRLYGRLVAERTGLSVAVDNQGVSGMNSNGLLDQLEHKHSGISEAVQAANIVLITIGANDFANHEDAVTRASCTPVVPDSCVAKELSRLPTNLHRILARIRSLRPGATVLMTGYWNVFQDGQVARELYTRDGIEASFALTRAANAAVADVARTDGAKYVDIFNPFEKPGLDVTTLLAPDGDHPNAAGHTLIAQTLAAEDLLAH
jgi:lysophospholipase L1-like esterase